MQRLGRHRRQGSPPPAYRRRPHHVRHSGCLYGSQAADEHLYELVDALQDVAEETGKLIPQVALNGLLLCPTVSSVIISARNEEQLRQNLGAVSWKLTPAQMNKLDDASKVTPIYPYWHQQQFERNPSPI